MGRVYLTKVNTGLDFTGLETHSSVERIDSVQNQHQKENWEVEEGLEVKVRFVPEGQLSYHVSIAGFQAEEIVHATALSWAEPFNHLFSFIFANLKCLHITNQRERYNKFIFKI